MDDSTAAGIAQWCSAALRARWSGFESRHGLGIFLFTTVSRPALGPTQPPIQWVSGAVSLGVKRPGCEADHSLPSNAEFKNAWSYTSTPQYAFMAWCSVKKSTGTTLPFRMTLLHEVILWTDGRTKLQADGKNRKNDMWIGDWQRKELPICLSKAKINGWLLHEWAYQKK
jgi:hypothetical protein